MDIKEFCEDTGLKLRKVNDRLNTYTECSGKSYSTIQSILREYNRDHRDGKVFCWDDEIKDVTYIEFLK